VEIPAGARVLSAHVGFVVDELKGGEADLPVTIAIYAEASDSAAALGDAPFDVSARPATEAALIWRPPRATDPAGADWSLCWEANHCAGSPWGVVGASVETPNIARVVQEVVGRPGWIAGNSLLVVFAEMSGTGVRTVESRTPTLTFEYDVSPQLAVPPPSACVAGVDGLHGVPSCETAHVGTGCAACPFGAEGDPDLTPDGWTHGAAQRCVVPDGAAFIGGTRICYCHGWVAVAEDMSLIEMRAAEAGRAGMQSCEQFGTEWYRNHESGHYADAAFEFLVRPAGCEATEANAAGFVCAHLRHETVLLASTADSAEEDVATGAMYLDSSDLELMSDGGEQVVGLRFKGVRIPRGAMIAEAHIGFEIDEVNDMSNDPVVIAIYAEYSGNAAPIQTDAAFSLSSRPPTHSSVAWSPPTASTEDETWGVVGGVVATPSIVSILHEVTSHRLNVTVYLMLINMTVYPLNMTVYPLKVTSHPAWRPGNSVVILFGHVSGPGVRWVVASESNEDLHGGPFLSFSLEESTGYASVVDGSESAEEHVGDGSLYLGSSDLELMSDDGVTEQVVGLRFPGLQIPVGAVMTAPTHLVFQVVPGRHSHSARYSCCHCCHFWSK
jgi:hypothetical protein